MTEEKVTGTDAERRMFREITRLVENGDRLHAEREIAAGLASAAGRASATALLDGLRTCLGQGLAAAESDFRRALASDARNTYAHYWLGKALTARDAVPEAAGSIQDALRIDPRMAEAWFFFGSMAIRGLNYDVAIHSLIEAVRSDIDNGHYWQRLNQWLPRVKIDGSLNSERSMLIEALRREKIEFLGIDKLLYLLLEHTSSVPELMRLSRAGALPAEIASGRALRLLDDELLLLVLQKTVLYHVAYEQLITELRRALLAAIHARAIPPGLHETAVRSTAALAIYALHTEFVLHATAAENDQLASCLQRLGNGAADAADAALLTAIAGCYGLLAEVLPDAGAAALASPFNRLGEFRDMCRFQLEEPRALRAIEPQIGALGRISDTISRAVRQQYEENPYPRWRFLGEPRTETLDNRIRRCLPHLAPDQQPALQALPDQAVEVLIAGCGTGRQALWCGREYPAARILAIDLSRASLAYGLLKAREFAIANVEFLHGDLLDLPELGRQFDFIESIGVLHHMADPARGLAALARCLRAGGWMKVALYSESARAAVRAARRRITEDGHPSTADGIRNFRHLLMSDTDDPLHEACIRWRDFFTLSECRDLLFHVQEHQFTTERIAAMIAPLGLQFMGLEADPEFLANNEPRVSDPTSLAQWGKFEKAHPDFFGSMYVMWLRRPA